PGPPGAAGGAPRAPVCGSCRASRRAAAGRGCFRAAGHLGECRHEGACRRCPQASPGLSVSRQSPSHPRVESGVGAAGPPRRTLRTDRLRTELRSDLRYVLLRPEAADRARVVRIDVLASLALAIDAVDQRLYDDLGLGHRLVDAAVALLAVEDQLL